MDQSCLTVLTGKLLEEKELEVENLKVQVSNLERDISTLKEAVIAVTE